MKKIRSKSGKILSNIRQFLTKKRIRWYVLANRSSASIYLNDSRQDFQFIKKLTFPMGRLKDEAFNLDRPGRNIVHAGRAKINFGVGRSFEHSKELAAVFAKKIANFLLINKNRGQFTELVLVSEPSFLGILRSALDPAIKKLVKKGIKREYISDSHELKEGDILKAIENFGDFPYSSYPNYFDLTERHPYPY